MTTSGVYSFSVNRDDIIRMAMLNIGKLEESETPTATETADCARFLNSLVKQWQGTTDFAPGLKTWTRQRGAQFLSNQTGEYLLGPGGTGWTSDYNTPTTTSAAAAISQAIINVTSSMGMAVGDTLGVQNTSGNVNWYTILTAVSGVVTLTSNLTLPVASGAVVYSYTTAATQPVAVEAVILRDQQGNDSPVDIIGQAQYDRLPAKANSSNLSDPSAVYIEFQLTNSIMALDCYAAQDVTKYLILTYLEAEQDFVNPSDTPAYPQEWYLALAFNLSKIIAPMFNAPWTQLQEQNAKMALAIAQKKEPETIVDYFQPGAD